jgi:26S proteasome regulatory subunit N6
MSSGVLSTPLPAAPSNKKQQQDSQQNDKKEQELLQLEPIRKAEIFFNQGKIAEAIESYVEFILSPLSSSAGEEVEKVRNLKETAIVRAGKMLLGLEQPALAISKFIRALEPIWVSFPRAKAAKLIKDLLDLYEDSKVTLSSDPENSQIQLLNDLIDWCNRDNRVFLKQSLQLRLADLYLINRKFTESLALTTELLVTFRRLDDKLSMVQTELLVSRTYFALKNIAKCRASLTAARTSANSIYCPPLVLANIDLQTGLLHAEEMDFSTAYSYFIEALDNYILSDLHPKGATSIKYMLLCKIMLGRSDELDTITKSKNARNYEIGREIEAMYAIGRAYQAKSIKELEKALDVYPDAIGFDPIIQSHFASLYDKLLEQNILKIIAPYSRLPISQVAEQLALSPVVIESKLSQMIIDKVFYGIIDQAGGFVEILKRIERDDGMANALKVLDNLDNAVLGLYALYEKKTSQSKD